MTYNEIIFILLASSPVFSLLALAYLMSIADYSKFKE